MHLSEAHYKQCEHFSKLMRAMHNGRCPQVQERGGLGTTRKMKLLAKPRGVKWVRSTKC
jgi:hypothetical protein